MSSDRASSPAHAAAARLHRGSIASRPLATARHDNDESYPDLDVHTHGALHETSSSTVAHTEEDYGMTKHTDSRVPVRWSISRNAALALMLGIAVLAIVAVMRLMSSVPQEGTAPQLPVPVDVATAVADTTAASPAPAAPGSAAPAAENAANPVVSVVGLVAKPGLVTLSAHARVADALAAAGGAIPGADIDALNLARPVADGEQIIVGALPSPDNPDPLRSLVIAPGQAVLGDAPLFNGAAPPAPDAEVSPGTDTGTPADAVNLNTADASGLEQLPGIGPATAAAIIAYRETNGPFTSVEQLLEVDGIGPGKLEKVRGMATV